MSNIIDLSLSELVLNIKNKKISSNEVTSAYVERSIKIVPTSFEKQM